MSRLHIPAEAIKRFAPDELHVDLGRRNPFRSLGGTSEIELGVAPFADRASRGATVEPATWKYSPSKVTSSSVQSLRTSRMNSFVPAYRCT
jgi:hypothetical protein